jgi:hypothetical protein
MAGTRYTIGKKKSWLLQKTRGLLTGAAGPAVHVSNAVDLHTNAT